MNVVMTIEGREAIPVRAIPLLTDWGFLPPDALVKVLSGKGRPFVFRALKAFKCGPDGAQPVLTRHWENQVQPEIEAIEQRIDATVGRDADGYGQWKSRSLAVLPPGVFVWKDEFECFHKENWSRKHKHFERSNSADAGESVPGLSATDIAHERNDFLVELNQWRDLDFNPLVPQWVNCDIMEGFESTSPHREAAGNANPTGKKLTTADENKVRDRHAKGETVSNIAKHFGVSRPTIDKALKNSSSSSRMHDPFGLSLKPKGRDRT